MPLSAQKTLVFKNNCAASLSRRPSSRLLLILPVAEFAFICSQYVTILSTPVFRWATLRLVSIFSFPVELACKCSQCTFLCSLRQTLRQQKNNHKKLGKKKTQNQYGFTIQNSHLLRSARAQQRKVRLSIQMKLAAVLLQPLPFRGKSENVRKLMQRPDSPAASSQRGECRAAGERSGACFQFSPSLESKSLRWTRLFVYSQRTTTGIMYFLSVHAVAPYRQQL